MDEGRESYSGTLRNGLALEPLRLCLLAPGVTPVSPLPLVVLETVLVTLIVTVLVSAVRVAPSRSLSVALNFLGSS